MATLKKTKNGFQDRLLLNAGQKYCRMPQGEHSAILSTFIKLPFAIKIFVLSIFECPFYTGFTVYCKIKGSYASTFRGELFWYMLQFCIWQQLWILGVNLSLVNVNLSLVYKLWHDKWQSYKMTGVPGPRGYKLFHAQLNWVWNLSST